jgi:alpha-D-ribose 1-methylphosphonate 5-triphosphate synthase subunit PhnG
MTDVLLWAILCSAPLEQVALGINNMNHYRILANSPEEQVCYLASIVIKTYAKSKVRLLSGPRQGLVMLRVRETVANSQFNAGEVLVTEVKLELEGQFGFGMVIGDSPRRAMAIALVDAALGKGGLVADRLRRDLAELERQLAKSHQHLQALVDTTRVEFERI